MQCQRFHCRLLILVSTRLTLTDCGACKGLLTARHRRCPRPVHTRHTQAEASIDATFAHIHTLIPHSLSIVLSTDNGLLFLLYPSLPLHFISVLSFNSFRPFCYYAYIFIPFLLPPYIPHCCFILPHASIPFLFRSCTSSPIYSSSIISCHFSVT